MYCPDCSKEMVKSYKIRVCFGAESNEPPYFHYCECGTVITNTGDRIHLPKKEK